MSSVLHPVGPEPARTYWLRRALVIGAPLVVLALLVALLTGRGGSRQAVPAPVAIPSTAMPSTPTPTPLASALPSGSAPNSATSAAKSTPPKASVTATGTKAPKPLVCDSATLRTTLTGKLQLKPNQDTTFNLSLINGSNRTCMVRVSNTNFALTISSGRGRIWSSADCPAAMKPFTAKLASQQAAPWTIRWNGLRSARGCSSDPRVPGPGTYVASAQLAGGRPAQMDLTLKK